VAAVQLTCTHKQYTEYTEQSQNWICITIKIRYNNKKLIGKCRPCPVFASYTLAFALQLREKHGKTSATVAAHRAQAGTVQYKNNEQYNTQKKSSNTEQYDVTEQ
jgi:predicted ATP-dependent serine protease